MAADTQAIPTPASSPGGRTKRPKKRPGLVLKASTGGSRPAQRPNENNFVHSSLVRSAYGLPPPETFPPERAPATANFRPFLPFGEKVAVPPIATYAPLCVASEFLVWRCHAQPNSG